MKVKTLSFVTGLLVLFVTSCDGLLDLGIEIDSNTTEVEFTVLPTDVVGEAVFATNTLDSELKSILEENDLSTDDLTSVKLKQAKIELLNEDESVTFDFFEKIEATIKVENLPELVIAVADSIPAGARSITCKIQSNELMEYLQYDQYIITAKGVSVAPITDTLFIEGTLKFGIHASASDLSK